MSFRFINLIYFHPEAEEAWLQDAIRRDRTTARRSALLRRLLHERYLTREQLNTRLEGLPRSFALSTGENGCFPGSVLKP